MLMPPHRSGNQRCVGIVTPVALTANGLALRALRRGIGELPAVWVSRLADLDDTNWPSELRMAVSGTPVVAIGMWIDQSRSDASHLGVPYAPMSGAVTDQNGRVEIAGTPVIVNDRTTVLSDDPTERRKVARVLKSRSVNAWVVNNANTGQSTLALLYQPTQAS